MSPKKIDLNNPRTLASVMADRESWLEMVYRNGGTISDHIKRAIGDENQTDTPSSKYDNLISVRVSDQTAARLEYLSAVLEMPKSKLHRQILEESLSEHCSQLLELGYLRDVMKAVDDVRDDELHQWEQEQKEKKEREQKGGQ